MAREYLHRRHAPNRPQELSGEPRPLGQSLLLTAASSSNGRAIDPEELDVLLR